MMIRNVEGLKTRVVNECLRKNVALGIIDRIAYKDIPPRVEYVVTPLDRKLSVSLDN